MDKNWRARARLSQEGRGELGERVANGGEGTGGGWGFLTRRGEERRVSWRRGMKRAGGGELGCGGGRAGRGRARPREIGGGGFMVKSVQAGPIDRDFSPATGDWAVPQKAATALNRYGHVDDIAAMVAFVASPDASYITGSNLTVDGGMNA